MAKSIRIRLTVTALVTILGVAAVLAAFSYFALPPFFAGVTAFALVVTSAAGTCLALLPNPAAWPREQLAGTPHFLPAGQQARLGDAPLFLDQVEVEAQAAREPEALPQPIPVPVMSQALPTGPTAPSAALLDLRWAQLTSHHARHLLLAAAECSPGRPIPHPLLRRATRLEPEAYRQALDLLCDLGLLQAHAGGPIIAAAVADHAHRAARRLGLPGRLPAVARASVHLTTEALLQQTAPLAASGPLPDGGPLWIHAERLANFALWTGLPEARPLWSNIACHSLLCGDHRRAAEALLEVTDLDTEPNGTGHPASLLALSRELQALHLDESPAPLFDYP
jgi:hypothetical protein